MMRFGLVVAGVVLAAAACGRTPVVEPATGVVESYGHCVVGTTYPCVVSDGEAFYVATSEYVGYGMAACVAEDGPAPCVWDTATHGNGRAGVGVKRYVMVRD